MLGIKLYSNCGQNQILRLCEVGPISLKLAQREPNVATSRSNSFKFRRQHPPILTPIRLSWAESGHFRCDFGHAQANTDEFGQFWAQGGVGQFRSKFAQF